MRFFRTLRLLFYGCFLAQLLSGRTHAKEPIIITPPLVKPATVSIPPRQPSPVYLRAEGRIEEPMTFLIRRPPKHGELGEIKRVDRNTAVVIYTPEDNSLKDDDFTYAAKSADSPVSASAVISLRIVDPPAVLEYAKELNFGAVFLGDQSQQTLSIRNTGGATATGSIIANPPWRVEGSSGFVIPGGSEGKVSLVFEPSDERDFRERILVGKGFPVQVTGTGVAPVSWPRDGVVIRPEVREAGVAIVLRNNTPKPLEISFQWPDPVSAPPSVTLPADGRESIHVGVKPGAGGSYTGDVRASIGHYSFTIPIKIYPEPPRILISPASLTLKVNKQHLAEGNFAVALSRESSPSLNFTLPSGMTVTPSPSDGMPAEGLNRAFSVALDLGRASALSGEIFVEASGCAPMRLPYKVERENREVRGTTGPVEKFLRIPTVSQPVTSATQLPRIDKIWLLSSEAHDVSVIWKKPSPEIQAFRVERRVMKTDSLGQLAIKWVRWPEAKIEDKGDTFIARFAHLPENSRWTIQIVPLDKDGNSGPPSPAFAIATKPVNPSPFPWWGWLFPLAALAVAVFQLWKKSRGELQAKADAWLASLEKK